MSNHHTDLTPVDGGAVPERFEDPGLHEHHERLGDVDPRANKRAERQVVVLFALSVLGTIGFLVAYALVPPDGTVAGIRMSNLLLGLALFVALAGIGLAAVHWAKSLMNDREVAEDRHPIASDAATREVAVAKLNDGIKDSAIGRRGVLKGAMVSSLALFPLAIAVPLVGNIGGDWNVSRSKHTIWKRGTRLALDPTGRPIKAADVTIGSVFHVMPEGIEETEHPLNEKAKAAVLLIRLEEDKLAAESLPGAYGGIVAYSKICTHMGCPVALYEQRTHHLLCPCHQSTFDLTQNCKVIFGPAKRALPQLPITVDDEGYLVAAAPFGEPTGPSFWERS